MDANSRTDKAPILVVGPASPSIGGVETFVETLLNSRLADKYQLIHIDTTRRKIRQKNLNRVTLISLYYLARQLATTLVACVRYRPRIIHQPITSLVSFWKGASFILLGRFFGLKPVGHLHGGYFRQYFTGQNHLVQAMIRWVFNQTSAIIALSEGWRQFIQKEIKPGAPVWVVPNTVDDMFVDRLRAREEPPSTDGHLTILFVGRLDEHKGVFDILKAAPLVLQEEPNLRFIIVGPEHYPGVMAQMKEICRQEGLDPHVQIPGPVMGVDKLDLFFSSSIFVLPSYMENFPYTVLEAMAAGLPVITTPVGALPEVIEEGVNGFLIAPGDFGALAEKVTLLARDERMRKEMAEANRAKVLQRFTPEAAMAELEKVYDELLALSPIEEQHHRLTDDRPNR